MTFKIGDKVKLKSENKLRRPPWKNQEVGVGIITGLFPNSIWCTVTWSNNTKIVYRHKGPIIDLIKFPEEPPMKTLQITVETLHNAHEKGCKEVKETLEILFPEEFKEKFDWHNFYIDPLKYITFKSPNEVIPCPELLEAFKEIDKPIPSSWWPPCTLNQFARLINFMNENRFGY